MLERIGNWFWTSALLLAACGSVDDPSSLAKSRAALVPNAATTTSSASFVPPPAERTCRSDADCGAAEECASEHGQYYCAPRREHKDYYGADAGAPEDECRHHGHPRDLGLEHVDGLRDRGPVLLARDGVGDAAHVASFVRW